MNLYIRYFDSETVVATLDQAFDFLQSLPDFTITDDMRADVIEYVYGEVATTRRVKVSSKSYFVMIKTTATTLEEFKQNAEITKNERKAAASEAFAKMFGEEQPGWYHVEMKFKRVLPLPDNSAKSQYVDTEFEVKLKAHSVQDCYDRVLEHFHKRGDVDARSQFPSIKGKNFKAEFLGM